MITIIAFLGPSGSGKSTLQSVLGYKPIVTWTSRKPRPGEINGKHYHFANRDQILNMYKEGLLLEYTEYNGNLYGTGLNSIKKLIESNDYSSIVVDANGAKELKSRFPSSVLIVGVLAPYDGCKENLIERKDKNVNERLATYSDEINSVMELSDIIINNSKENWGKSTDIIKMLKLGMEKY
tara:strand:+ start:283 stop:825 length:543 start_codon:yes stop_codon:yes gene_type:complete